MQTASHAESDSITDTYRDSNSYGNTNANALSPLCYANSNADCDSYAVLRRMRHSDSDANSDSNCDSNCNSDSNPNGASAHRHRR